jgi:hypothetical protein
MPSFTLAGTRAKDRQKPTPVPRFRRHKSGSRVDQGVKLNRPDRPRTIIACSDVCQSRID